MFVMSLLCFYCYNKTQSRRFLFLGRDRNTLLRAAPVKQCDILLCHRSAGEPVGWSARRATVWPPTTVPAGRERREQTSRNHTLLLSCASNEEKTWAIRAHWKYRLVSHNTMKDEYYSKDVFFGMCQLLFLPTWWNYAFKNAKILKIALVSRFIYVQGKKEKPWKVKLKYCKHQYLRKANFFFVIF